LQVCVFLLWYFDVVPVGSSQASCILAPEQGGAVFGGDVNILSALRFEQISVGISCHGNKVRLVIAEIVV